MAQVEQKNTRTGTKSIRNQQCWKSKHKKAKNEPYNNKNKVIRVL